jgi:quercetin dioxygenase-like cupin family protein
MSEIGMSQNWEAQNWETLALHQAESRTWTRVGSGLELAIVGKDAATGATAMFQRVTRTDAQQIEATPHTHSVVCETLVLSGVVEMTFESDNRTMKAGDYLRVPAGTPHMQTLVSDDAEMFVMTHGNPGIEFVVPERWSASAGA